MEIKRGGPCNVDPYQPCRHRRLKVVTSPGSDIEQEAVCRKGNDGGVRETDIAVRNGGIDIDDQQRRSGKYQAKSSSFRSVIPPCRRISLSIWSPGSGFACGGSFISGLFEMRKQIEIPAHSLQGSSDEQFRNDAGLSMI